jgi:hypothetical protein
MRMRMKTVCAAATLAAALWGAYFSLTPLAARATVRSDALPAPGFHHLHLKLGDTRAVMIEGPSREALELVEVK